MTRRLLKIFVIKITVLVGTSATAFDPEIAYFIAGVSYAGVDNAYFNNEVGLPGQPQPIDETVGLQARGNIGWRAGIGTWYSEHFGVEFNYFGIADLDDNRRGVFNDNGSAVAVTQKIDVTGMYFFDLTMIGRWYFLDDFWGFARLGVAVANVNRRVNEVRIENQNEQRTKFVDDHTGLGVSLGVGFQYDVNEYFGLRADLTTIQASGDTDMYAIAGNVVFNFGSFLFE